MARHAWGAAVATVLALSLSATGCGEHSPRPKATTSKADGCSAQWHKLAGTVVGLDEDTDPSALAERWTSVIATIQYYEVSPTANGCAASVAAQQKAIDALQAFSDRVRPYDMTYQLSHVQASADLYAHDPLPEPVRNARGKLVKPPAKAAVATAMTTLSTEASAANTELAPGWGELTSVELTDAAAVTAALADLDSLAQDSPHWQHCEQALQVVMAAVHAQDGTS